jgi:hypothetical protein
MKVLIVDAESQLYLAHQNRWTDRAQEAKDFSFTTHARTVAKAMGLSRFQILFYFAEIDYRIVISDSTSEPKLAKA